MNEDHRRLVLASNLYLLFGSAFGAAVVYFLIVPSFGVISYNGLAGIPWFLLALVIGLLNPALLIGAAICIRKNLAYTFCYRVAVYSCLMLGIGTAIGIYTMFTLDRPGVRRMFMEDRNE